MLNTKIIAIYRDKGTKYINTRILCEGNRELSDAKPAGVYSIVVINVPQRIKEMQYNIFDHPKQCDSLEAMALYLQGIDVEGKIFGKSMLFLIRGNYSLHLYLK
jgi:hypothetical protein